MIQEKTLIRAQKRLAELSRTMTDARKEELEIREFLFKELYPKDKHEGSTTITVGSTKVSITNTLRRTISREDAEKLKLDKPEIWATVLRFTPDVKVAEFRKHEDELSDYVVTKSTPPTITFK